MPTPADDRLIGSAPQMQRAIERVEQVAPTDLTVLITGESGTGKEVVARAIYNLSRRRKQRFVSLNCGAIPENLLEAELFGNEKGAFTGAVEQRKGFFEAADKGTIFLDELGEMPLATQVKLLRVLETGEFSRLGSSDTLRVDVRVIAATNRHLEDDVARGQFRRDLYYRLNAVHITLPALREHREDIPALVQYFAGRVANKLGIRYAGMDDEALRLLMSLDWPGNVRELRNVVETLVTLERGERVTAERVRLYLPAPMLLLPEPRSIVQNVERGLSQGLSPHSSQRALPPHLMDAEVHAFANGLDDAHDPHTTNHEDVYTVEPEAARALVHVSGKTQEQIERELMYKAMLDMANQLEGLRVEIAQLKEAFYRQHPNTTPDFDVSRDATTQNLVPVLPADIEAASLRLEEMEQKLIVAALERHSGNRRLAASALGLSERTLYRKLHEYNLLERFP
jgi:DNA-binding NtrC family response regulator